MILILIIYSCYITDQYLNTKDKLCYEEQTYYVCPGDTLWGLANKYSSDTDNIKQWISEVKRINGMKTSDIAAGSEIIILVDDKE